MNNILIDFDLLDLGGERNPFEELISKMEEFHLKSDGSLNYDFIEKTILYLERKCQDFSESNTDKSKAILEAVNAANVSISMDTSFNINSIVHNLHTVKLMSNSMEHESNFDFKLYSISNIIKTAFPDKEKVSSGDIQYAFESISSKMREKIKENLEEWVIDLNFEVERDKLHKPLEFIHTFIEGLNKIEGLHIILEEIKIGSLKARLKLVFDNLKSKEEFKEVIEGTRKLAKGKLEKDFNESEKANSEKNKIEIETAILEEKLSELNSIGLKEIKELEKESLKFDNERKKIENERLKLLLFKERKEMLKELLSEGIIDQGQFEILIKGIPFLSIKNGQLTVGESIDVIDDL